MDRPKRSIASLMRGGLRRRGPHQMRHTFASLLLAAGEPITYVSRQLGHRDVDHTARTAQWLPDTSARTLSTTVGRIS